MVRLADWLTSHGGTLAAIHVTLDTHHALDIAHPAWWIDADGRAPAPFTIVTSEDLDRGRLRAADSQRQGRSRAYVDALAAGGRYPLCIWPEHCLLGSPGHAIAAPVRDALTAWERTHRQPIDFVLKGMNPWTEHYSALRADVPDPDDTTTALNTRLIDALRGADTITVAGEAGSHCVAHTLRDLVAVAPELAERLVLLTDAVSPVAGFEALQDTLIADLTRKGLRTYTTLR
jgi:nicotinamidase-related amidase